MIAFNSTIPPRRTFGLVSTLAAGLLFAACGDGTSAGPDKSNSATTATAALTAPTASVSTTAPSEPSGAPGASAPTPETSASAPAPSASASGEPVASATSTSTAAPTAGPVSKGFAIPSPKSGVLTVAEADKLAPSGSKPKIKLLDAGKDPLNSLAYAPTKGETVGLRLDLSQKVAIAAEGQTAPAVLSPPQSLDVDVTTEDASETSALVAMLLKNINLAPVDGLDKETLGELTKQLGGLRGYAMRSRISSKGETSDVKVDMPLTAPKGSEMLVTSMGAVFRMLLPVFPSESVGTGAKWQVLSREDHAGASVVQLVEYTLKERGEHTCTIDMKSRQLAAGDNVKLPTGTPLGVTTKLTKFTTTSTGQFVFDLRQMAPTKGKITQDSKLGLDVFATGQLGTKMKTEADMKMTVTISRRAGSASPATTAAPSAAPTAK
ncbi:MAG: hypothetical protein IPK82_07080 [Polyangiaceae bacterium]|nr:hypothetical protein [Polyangiaceae bacterium]